jgi:serine/threonine protein kinase
MNDRNVTIVHQSGSIRISRDEATVLRDTFQGYARIALEAEFGMGFSGCRVFRVRPVEAGGVAHRPALIKIGPIGLINKEWQAYNAWVKNTLPGIAYVTSEPIITPGSSRGVLQYELVGSGIFEIRSLSQYFRQASTDDLLWVMQKRLFPVMSHSWWLVNRAESTFQYRSDYDQLLPINLLATATEPSGNTETHLISPIERSLVEATIGSQVRFEGFVVTELNPGKRQLTLNLPRPDENRMADSLRLRINGVPAFSSYQVGDLIEPLHGIVTATRHSTLETLVKNILGEEVDLSLSKLRLSSGVETTNPLLAYKELLNSFLHVNVSTIHGDFNLENILIDPDTRDVKVIDFATVRRGHNLHDLLRLETEVITKLIPEIFNSVALPPETIQTFYDQLAQAGFGSRAQVEPQLPHPDLGKPFAMIRAIRQEARKCFFNPDEPREYHQGLIIYLLGSLKFDNLDAIQNAKLVAFLGAGAIVDQLNAPSDAAEAAVSAPYPKPEVESVGRKKGMAKRVSRLWIGVGLFLLAILLGALIYEFLPKSPQPVPVEHLYEIENDLVTEFVEGPAVAGDLLIYFNLANPELFAHIEHVEKSYLEGENDPGITYVWGSPGVGKSFITRFRLNEGFPGDSCLVKLSDVFGDDSEALSFEVVQKPDLTTLDGGLAFDSLPAVVQANDYELESLFEVAGCMQGDGLVPLIILDDIDEVHSETSSLILRSLDRFILNAAEADEEFVQVMVIGRAEGFAPWYQDPKRNDDGSITELLSVFRLNGPEFMTTGDLEVLADNQFAFVLGSEIWEQMIQDGTADGLIDGFVDYVVRHPTLTYSTRILAIATMITDRSRAGVDDSEAELKEFLFDELLRRASNVHNRPLSNDLQYRRILEDIAVLYASEEKVDDQGFFTVGLNDTVPVMEEEQIFGEVNVHDVLDHSGIAILEPASFSTARYRFEPVWVHSYLVELHNQRVSDSQGEGRPLLP